MGIRSWCVFAAIALGAAAGFAPASAAQPNPADSSAVHPSAPASHVVVIHFGKLIDGKGRTLTNAQVLVQGDRIRAVTTSTAGIPADAERIELARYTGIPGLIDAHTHMTYYWDQTPGTKPWEQLNARPPMQTMFLAQENARKTLEAGVTTVRDLGSFQYMDIAMRDLINRGAMTGPRMFVAGYGLYPTYTPYQDVPQPPAGGLADGVEQVMRATRHRSRPGWTSSRSMDRRAAPTT